MSVCLKKQQRQNIQINKNYSVEKNFEKKNGFILYFKNGEKFDFDKILIATGGNPKSESYNWIKVLGHTIIEPVPSLFTFTLSQNIFEGLEGISVPEVEIILTDEKTFRQKGSLLITHGGLSGFGILKFSAFAARELSEKNYKFSLSINWLPGFKNEQLLKKL